MANVLDYNTYQFPLSKGRKPTSDELLLRYRYDYNALSPLKRQYFTYIRGLALNLLVWIACNYDVTPTDLDETPVESNPCEVMVEFMMPYLTKQACAILNYKRRAEAQKLPGVPNCSARDVHSQLYLLFNNNPNIINDIDFINDDISDYESFAFGDCHWQVKKRATPIRIPGTCKTSATYVLMFSQLAEDDPYTVGTTRGDRMFEKGVRSSFKPTKGQGVSKQTTKVDGGPDEEQHEKDGENQDNIDAGVGRKRKRQAS